MSASGIKAGSAYVEIFSDKSRLVRDLKSTSADLNTWASGAARAGGALLGVGAGSLTGLAATTKMFADAGSVLDDTSQRTGIAGSKLSQLQYAVEQSGSDLPTLEGGFKKLQDSLVWPSDTEKANATLAKLRINAGAFRAATGDEQLKQFADAIAAIPDPAARTAAAIDAMGKSGTQLLPFLIQGRAGIEALQAEADRLGITMSDEDIAQAAKLGDTYDRVAATAKRTAIAIGAALAPAAEEFANGIATGVGAASKWISENRGVVTGAALIAAGTAAAGIGIIGLGVALKAGAIVATAASVAWMGCGAALTFLTSPLGIVTVALGVGAYAAERTNKTFSRLASDAKPAFETLKSDASSAFAGIRAAMSNGDLAGAAEIAWALIDLEWTRGTSAVAAKYDQFRDVMAGAFSRFYNGAVVMASDGWDAVNSIWYSAGDMMASAWDSSTAYVLGLFDDLIVKAQQAGAVAVAVYKYARDTATGQRDGTLKDYNAREQQKIQPAEDRAKQRDEERSKSVNINEGQRQAAAAKRKADADKARSEFVNRLEGDLAEQTEIDAANRAKKLEAARAKVAAAEQRLKSKVSAAEAAQRKANDKTKPPPTGDDPPDDGTDAGKHTTIAGTTQAGVASQLAFAFTTKAAPKQPDAQEDPTKSPGRAAAAAADAAMIAANALNAMNQPLADAANGWNDITTAAQAAADAINNVKNIAPAPEPTNQPEAPESDPSQPPAGIVTTTPAGIVTPEPIAASQPSTSEPSRTNANQPTRSVSEGERSPSPRLPVSPSATLPSAAGLDTEFRRLTASAAIAAAALAFSANSTATVRERPVDPAQPTQQAAPLSPEIAARVNVANYVSSVSPERQSPAQQTIKVELGSGLEVVANKLDAIRTQLERMEPLYG